MIAKITMIESKNFALMMNSSLIYVALKIPNFGFRARSQAPALIVIHKSRRDKNYRHSGRDAGIQAMDGNFMVWHLSDLTAAQADRLPSLDAGSARHIPVIRA